MCRLPERYERENWQNRYSLTGFARRHDLKVMDRRKQGSTGPAVSLLDLCDGCRCGGGIRRVFLPKDLRERITGARGGFRSSEVR
jgi:hypothetical protein